MKIVHVITGLAAHGAETMLYRLLAGSTRSEYRHEVISLTDRGVMADKIEALGVPVRVLGMRPGVPNPLAIMRLAGMLRQSRPQLVQTWMYHADLVGGLATRIAGDTPVVWGVHHTRADWRETKFLTALTVRICALLSRRLPAGIVCCSEASQQAHVELGYAPAKMRVIPNGIDVNEFRPDPDAGLALRKALGIPAEALVIGLAARFHPNKDHKTFFQAAGLLHKNLPNVHFVLCGDGVVQGNLDVAAQVDAAQLRGRCHLLGARSDMPSVYAAWDIATSSSVSEAFPLVVGEAMACEVPCVVTEVGDCPTIVGDTGKVVSPQRPERMAEAWRELLESGAKVRQKMGAAARERVVNNYSLPALIEQYQALYRTFAQDARGLKAASEAEQTVPAARVNAKSA